MQINLKFHCKARIQLSILRFSSQWFTNPFVAASAGCAALAVTWVQKPIFFFSS
jgi:hypothetical protein